LCGSGGVGQLADLDLEAELAQTFLQSLGCRVQDLRRRLGGAA
jgi:hypothetical protein